LEKGNFRDEVTKYAQLLEDEKSNKAEHLKKVDAVQAELAVLTDSKKQLLAEVEGLQKTISDLQEKMKATEQEITDRFTAELKEKTELLAKEATKAANLNSFINNLKGQESSGKLEIAKVKAENKQLHEKYSCMAAEHSQAFSVCTSTL
jgi:chromosome segregation ATPase